jgi:hypothetical protein
MEWNGMEWNGMEWSKNKEGAVIHITSPYGVWFASLSQSVVT